MGMKQWSTPTKLVVGGLAEVLGLGFNVFGGACLKSGFNDIVDNYASPFLGGGNNTMNIGMQPQQQALPQQQMPMQTMQQEVPNIQQPVTPSNKIV